MKILFVWFNFDCPIGFSHGLAVLSHELKAAGHSVGLLHINEAMGTPWNPSSIAQTIRRKHPDIVGFSFGTNHAWAARELAAAVKRALPGAALVCGGIHTTIVPEEVAAWEGVDLAFAGEADDHRLCAIVERLGKGSVPVASPGVWTKGPRDVRGNPMPPPVDLAAAPRPADLDLFDHRRILELKRGYADAISGRGCAYRCTYCYHSAFSRGYASEFSAERVVAQVERVKKLYHPKFIRFNEDNFAFNRKRLRNVCKTLIERKIRIRWACESRADLSEADIALMARSGCVAMGLGPETGSQRMLDFIKKGITTEEIERCFWRLVKYHIRIVLYVMYGFPTETATDFQDTQDFLVRLDNPPYLFSRFVPIPGSELYQYCIDHNLISAPKRLEDWPEFIIRYGHSANLSLVPPAMIDAANDRFRARYAIQRFRFTLRHDPGYFWTAITNPAKFAREMRELIRYHIHMSALVRVRKVQFASVFTRQEAGPALAGAPARSVAQEVSTG